MDPRTLRDFTNDQLRDEIHRYGRMIESLSPQLSDLEVKSTALRTEIARHSQQLGTMQNELERRLRPAPEPRISDHALLRYIERVHGVNLDQLRALILTPKIVQAIQAGAIGVVVNDVKFVVSGYTIVTVLGEDQRFKNKTARHGKIIETEDAAVAIRNGLTEYEEARAEVAA